MASLPYFPVYVGDTMRSRLMQCTLEAIGFHFKLKVIFLHDSERYGYLIEDNQATPLGEVARRTWEPLDRCQTLLDELLRKGVLGRSKDGHLYDHELVKQQEQRDATRGRVRKHRRQQSVTPVKRLGNGDVTPIEDEIDNKQLLLWFDEVWRLYPRPLGRKLALRSFLGSVKTARGFERLKAALVNYKAKLAEEKTDPKFVQHGSTWFNNWSDWVEIKTYNPVEDEAKLKADKRERWIAEGKCFKCGSEAPPGDDGIKRCDSCMQEQP